MRILLLFIGVQCNVTVLFLNCSYDLTLSCGVEMISSLSKQKLKVFGHVPVAQLQPRSMLVRPSQLTSPRRLLF